MAALDRCMTKRNRAEYWKLYQMREAERERQEQKKVGHWTDRGSLSCRCSECGCKSTVEADICPVCGAKMLEPQERETWNGIHAQITAPKGTFERIVNDTDDDDDI